MTVMVRQVDAAIIRSLRNRVLRPDQPDKTWPYDTDPHAVHLAAYLDERLVGCATIFPSPYEELPIAWQLRGMAVDPDVQGHGIGRQLLEAAVGIAAAAGAPLMWAYGRISALGFYQRLGWEAVGDEFVHADSGLPHRIIRLPISPG